MNQSPKTCEANDTVNIETPSSTHQQTNKASILAAKTSYSPEWLALSPWSMVSNIGQSLKVILSNGFALIPIFYTGWQKGFSLQWSIAVFALLTLILLLSAFIQWRKFRYRLNAEQLEVKQGLLFTKKHEIPFNKIQNIRFEQPFYYKPLALATLVIETAGSKKDEAKLAAMARDQALVLKAQLLKKPDADNVTISASSSANIISSNSGELVTKRSLKQLIIFGLYQNNFIWFAIFAGPVLGQVQWEEVIAFPPLQQALVWLQLNTQHNIGLQLAIFLGLLFIFYSLISAISILASVLKYHPYQLRIEKHTLQRSGGVISHQQDALKTHRIQIIHFEQPFLATLLGYWTVYFKQVKGQEIEQQTKQHMLIPSVKAVEIPSLLNCLPELKDQQLSLPKQYIGIDIAWFLRRAQLALFPASLLTLIHLFLENPAPILPFAWSATIVVIGLLFLRYRRWGFWLEDDAIWLHSGVLGQQWKRVHYNKVQHVELIQTLGQKHNQLAYINLGTASGTLTLPYISYSAANAIKTQVLEHTNKDHKNWI
ncbi:PH domain-containing protein [Shewanella intestini]|uniref:PH domain-containing protein n=1 Tax=Shewanella intestini TaxID=2017544 RepID=A0ABS5HXH1_9GAMM|nr:MULTISPECIES: PH domain-containing protein [Shewanella]MBR9726428.1 PH domain-containing protein [Shewanella intestini]MRG35006.1 PH domain-containing protein [Shewanella sp. XMDDZSB0408]